MNTIAYEDAEKRVTDDTYEMSPLFVPLKTEFYDDFDAGRKPSELRLYGERWNEKTCPPGRPVILSKGYGKKHRLRGVITAFRRCKSNTLDPLSQIQIAACYGPGIHDIAEIFIRIKR